MSQSESRRGVALVALCCAVYFTSYLTRKGYEASILAICDATGLARTAAGLASMATLAVYGLGQFATGFLADLFDPRKIIFLALLVTAGCNAAIPWTVDSVPAMVAVCAVNGFAQAMFWPPIVKIVAQNLRPEAYKGAVFWISVVAQAAIIAVFFLVSGCTHFAGWRLSFAVVTGLALAMAALWAATVRRYAPGRPGDRPGMRRPAQDEQLEKEEPTSGKTEAHQAPATASLGALLVAAGILPIMAAIVCQGFLRDGIEVWASSIVKDQYGLGTSGSIFSVSLLPIFGVASMAATRALRRWIGDEVKAAAALFATGLVCATLLFAANGATLAVGLPVLAILSATMHGANLLLTAEVPGHFARHRHVGTVAGLLNAFTYVGAAISIYGFPVLCERLHGWRPVFAVWMAVLALAVALCLLALRRWLPFTRGDSRM